MTELRSCIPDKPGLTLKWVTLMDQSKSNGENIFRKRSLPVFGVLLAIMISFPYLIIRFPEEWQQPITIWFRVLIYFFMAILIWLERSDLLSFNIDKASVWIFLLGRTLLTFVMLLFYNFGKDALFLWGAFLVSVYIAITLWRALPREFLHNNNRKRVLVWTGIGFLSGTMLAAAIIAIGYWGLDIISIQSPRLVALRYYVYGFIQALCNPAIDEELIYRGFLWGYLKRIGLEDKWVLFITSGLFLVGHKNFLNSGWVGLLLALPFALFLGLLVWRSRSLVPSLLSHATFNAVWGIVIW